MKEKQLDFGRYKINYAEAGQGKPMIFLHNGGGFWQIWKHQLVHFSASHKVYALDWIGFGSSSECAEALTLDFAYRSLRHFISTLEIKNFILVGNCIGATSAIKYKQMHPAEVSHLILMNICPGIRLVHSGIMRKWLFNGNPKSMSKIILSEILRFNLTKSPLKRKFPRILFGKEYDPEDALSKKYRMKFREKRQTDSRLNLLFSVDSYTLEDIRDPEITLDNTLLLWGSDNRVAPLKEEASYHQKITGLDEIKIIQSAGHLLMYESAKEVNELIARHIES